MITSFKSRKLKRFWEKNDCSKINPNWVDRVSLILDRLDQCEMPEDMDIPGFDFHPLIGESKGRYSVEVQGNWCITFGWEDGDAIRVDLEDYH